MIDGIWWLVILLAVVAVLWLLAHLRGAREGNDNKNIKKSRKQKSPNDALQRTAALLKQYFPDYRVTRRANHLLITKRGKKVAMITIDRNMTVGQRRLGNVPIINYHRVPRSTQLRASLQEAE